VRGSLRTWRAVAVAAAVAVPCVIGTGTASAAQGVVPIGCTFGYLCVQQAPGTLPTLVPAGQSRIFNPGITATSISNLTSQRYCIVADASFDIGAGQTSTATRTVYSVIPAPPNTVCPT